MPNYLILYVPVIHQGYIELLKNWAPKTEILYIIGEDIIADFPLDKRELRRINPETMMSLVKGLNLFSNVQILNKADITNIQNAHIVMANETISHTLKEKYFDKQNITVEFTTIFLRWDEKTVQSQTPVESDTKISTEDFDRQIMQSAFTEADKSADWFRQVGSVLIKDGQVIATSYNQRQPSPQSAYAEGDPRNYVPLGTNTHLRLTIHSEQAVIAEAAKKGLSTEGADLYASTFPCPDCAAVIAHAGIKRCFYGEGYASLDGAKIFKSHGVEIIMVQPVLETVK